MADIWDERKKGGEEDYFHRKDQELLEQMRQRLAAEEREHDKEASFLQCPKCGEKLEEILFRGIMVERCTGCQGVWLETGEVERLTARASRGWLALFWRSLGR